MTAKVHSTIPSGEALTIQQVEILRHMLGAQTHIKKRKWGFRNYFNAENGHDDEPILIQLLKMDLVVRGRPGYWHCTVAGCVAAGLTPAQIRRAIHGD